jgi:sugar phosphate isomerase/epimerase
MLLGYNTNGFAHHRLDDAIRILADLGYKSVAVTLDYHALNPYDPEIDKQVAAIRRQLERLGLHSVVETGARFLLDPLRKHQPTLLSDAPEERRKRFDFLVRAIGIARDLGSDTVGFWSGTPTRPVSYEALMDRLEENCRRLADEAGTHSVRLAFEPEPGMFIDTMPRFAELHRRVNHPSFGLTIDIGHLHCMGEIPIEDHLRKWQSILWNIHIEDMRKGVHDHLMFSEGEIDFVPVMRTLRDIGYAGGVNVELSRHSHNAVETARRAIHFLNGMMDTFPASRSDARR